eukprot:2882921-Rhodomonas_salina.3
MGAALHRVCQCPGQAASKAAAGCWFKLAREVRLQLEVVAASTSRCWAGALVESIGGQGL